MAVLGACGILLAGCGLRDGQPLLNGDTGVVDGPDGFVAPDVVDTPDVNGPDIPVFDDPDTVIGEEGTGQAYLLSGTVLAPDGAFEGEVLVIGDTIMCVAESCAAEAEGTGAWLVDTQGVILPGLIDTHNHILFDIFDNDDWVPNLPSMCGSDSDCVAGSSYCGADRCRCVDNICRYTNHSHWTKEAEYTLMLDYKQCMADASQGKPDWCPAELDEDGDLKCEMQKWGELKGLVAGTTSIVGLPGTSSKCVASLSRSIDVAQNDLDTDKVQTSALFPPSKSSADGVCKNYDDGDTDAYLIHVGEGTDQDALAEFGKLYTASSEDGCLFTNKTAITHGTSFTAAEFTSMAEAGMNLIWSPQSNISLYGRTTDIPAALDAGLLIALGPDWSMGGSQNLLDEVRFANEWDDAHWGDRLSPRDLFHMATSNAAKILGLQDEIGSLTVGLKADILVLDPQGFTPHEALLYARPANVRLVLVGGTPLFGDIGLQPLAPLKDCEVLAICGEDKFLCVKEESTQDKLNQTLVDIQGALEAGMQAIDLQVPVDPSTCGGCKADEECFLYTAKPIVDASLCPSACAADEACIQAKKSGDDQNQCLPRHTCSPAKSHKTMSPIAPLVRCGG